MSTDMNMAWYYSKLSRHFYGILLLQFRKKVYHNLAIFANCHSIYLYGNIFLWFDRCVIDFSWKSIIQLMMFIWNILTNFFCAKSWKKEESKKIETQYKKKPRFLEYAPKRWLGDKLTEFLCYGTGACTALPFDNIVLVRKDVSLPNPEWWDVL